MRTSDLINQNYRHHQRTPAPRDPSESRRGTEALAAGTVALVVLLLMLGGSFLLWVAVPMGTLWLGSWIQTSTDSLALAVGVMFIVAFSCIIAIGFMLAGLNRRHAALQMARGMQPSARILEGVLVVSAVVALSLFGIWFLLLSSPVPQAVPGIMPT
jgi:hypothetical protein